jgi:hypothetical protein
MNLPNRSDGLSFQHDFRSSKIRDGGVSQGDRNSGQRSCATTVLAHLECAQREPSDKRFAFARGMTNRNSERSTRRRRASPNKKARSRDRAFLNSIR